MAMTVAQALEIALKAVKDDEARDELNELKGRRMTLADLESALDDATDEDRERFKAALIRHGIGEEEAERIADGSPAPPANGDGGSAGDASPPEPAPPAKKTRPGRKSGQAYQWTVDDEGNVVKKGTATVYNGPDEDDEVEIPE